VAAVLAAAGAHVQAELPRSHHSADVAAAVRGTAPCVVLEEKAGDDRHGWKLDRARTWRLPIVGMDWLRESLMGQVHGGVPLAPAASRA
jgi:hypothetical protein